MLISKGTLRVQRYLALAVLGCVVSCSSNDGGGHDTSSRIDVAHGGSSGRGSDSDSGLGTGGEVMLGFDDDSGLGSMGFDGGKLPGDTCAAAKAEVKPVPLDIALLVDTSYSMDFDLRWQYVKGALLSFVSSPAQDDLGLSLQFFPLREQCDVGSYALPALPMATVADARDDIAQTLGARRMSGGTPLVQVLQGMGDYAAKWATDHADHKTVIVVATDGVPDATCSATSLNPPNDLPNAAKTAKALATGSPALPVFVIGVGDELDALNAIADAGGTGSAVLISNGANAQRDLLEALRSIRQKSLGCEYLVPDASSGAIDYNTANVDFTEGRAKSTFFYVDDASGCGLKPNEGWYYDDAKSPTKVILCPATCDRVANAEAARIDIAYGCKRREVR
jgi:hypothetical protein